MSPDYLAQMTLRIIAGDGFAHYLATAVYPARREVAVPEGMAGDVDVESEALAWAPGRAHEGEEFLVAFRVDESHFMVVRWADAGSGSASYRVPHV